MEKFEEKFQTEAKKVCKVEFSTTNYKKNRENFYKKQIDFEPIDGNCKKKPENFYNKKCKNLIFFKLGKKLKLIKKSIKK